MKELCILLFWFMMLDLYALYAALTNSRFAELISKVVLPMHEYTSCAYVGMSKDKKNAFDLICNSCRN